MSKATLHIIVAIADNGAIGYKGDMPWGRNLPADLRHFKETTMGHPIVMGRKTFESLPNGALPGRQNIIVTRNKDYTQEDATVVHSLEEALEVAQGDQLFLIGGGELYRQGIDLADVLHITLVHHEWQKADTFFPDVDIDTWACTSIEEHDADERNLYSYSFTTWHRK